MCQVCWSYWDTTTLLQCYKCLELSKMSLSPEPVTVDQKSKMNLSTYLPFDSRMPTLESERFGILLNFVPNPRIVPQGNVCCIVIVKLLMQNILARCAGVRSLQAFHRYCCKTVWYGVDREIATALVMTSIFCMNRSVSCRECEKRHSGNTFEL